MARRSKKPIFIDEPIQWHLSTSKHDRCTLCGMKDVGYLGKTRRTCMNAICCVNVELQMPSTEWLHEKMLGESYVESEPLSTNWLSPPERSDITIVSPEGRSSTNLTLVDAIGLSGSGIAVIRRKEAWTVGCEIYWRKGDPWPFYYERGKEVQVCAPGSPFWKLLVQTRWWYPSRKLSPLELLAHQAPREEDIKERFLIMS